jgi:hypothetical protein
MGNKIVPKWSPRSYQPGDEKGIFELWEAVYPDREYDYKKWICWWHWLNTDNPAGKSWIWIAEDKNNIVGQSVIIPVKVKINTDTVIAFQSIDTMTHPDYRRQGMYETLARKVYYEAVKDGANIGYRFPNENSHPIAINKLDWFDVGTMKYSIKPLNWKNTLKTRINNPFLCNVGSFGGKMLDSIISTLYRDIKISGLSVEKISSFDHSVDELWSRTAEKYPIIVAKSSEYLNWKYVSCPTANYSLYAAKNKDGLQGCVVFGITRQGNTKSALVFEMFSKSEKVARLMIGEIICSCRKENIDYINYLYIGNGVVAKAIGKKGFVNIPFVKKWFCAYSASTVYSKEFLKDRHNWLVQIGDSDMT